MSIFDSRRLDLIPEALVLGLASLSIQVILARLAVGFAGGNEVYLGLLFLLWLLLTAGGALYKKAFRPAALFLALALITPFSASVFFIAPILAGNLPGQLVAPPLFFATAAVALLPICLVNGALFNSIAWGLAGDQRSGLTYFNEALGALAGGISSAIYYFSGGRDFSYLIAICLVCLIPVGRKSLLKNAIIITCAILVAFWGAGDRVEDFLLALKYKPLNFRQSVSGRLIRYDATTSGDLMTVYSGGLKSADFPDEAAGPELFYWPLLIRPDLKHIAFVGAEMTMINALIPDSIGRAFIYPEVSWRNLVNQRYLPSRQDSRFADPVTFFKKATQKFDAIVINSGPLISISQGRLETADFFKSCRARLSLEGILVVSVPAFDGLWPEDLRDRLCGIYNKLCDLFPATDFIPGEKLIFVAGDNLDLAPDNLIIRHDLLDIDSPYMTPALIRTKLSDYKVDQTRHQLDMPSQSVGPLAIGPGLTYSLREAGFKPNLIGFLRPWVLILLVIIVAVPAVFYARPAAGNGLDLLIIVFFGAASFYIELLAFYHIQLTGGYLYIVLGVIIGLFMVGLALGAHLFLKFTKSGKLPKLLRAGANPALVLFAFLAAIFLFVRGSETALLMTVTLAGIAGGYGYAAIAGLFGNNPGVPYGFDLLGAVIGNAAGLAILAGAITEPPVLWSCCGFGMLLAATNALWGSKLG